MYVIDADIFRINIIESMEETTPLAVRKTVMSSIS